MTYICMYTLMFIFYCYLLRLATFCKQFEPTEAVK